MRAVGALLFVLAILPSGCSPGKHPTAAVSGLVTFEDRPLSRGRVIFMHPSGQYGHGDIGPDGRYSLMAPLGECRVAITSREAPPPERKEPGLFIPKTLIPERYEDHM